MRGTGGAEYQVLYPPCLLGDEPVLPEGLAAAEIIKKCYQVQDVSAAQQNEGMGRWERLISAKH